MTSTRYVFTLTLLSCSYLATASLSLVQQSSTKPAAKKPAATVMQFFANDDDVQRYGRFYRALPPVLMERIPPPPPPPPPPALMTTAAPASMLKAAPCKASMTFGFGDAAAEEPCTMDPEGNMINAYHMKLLAAAIKTSVGGHGMPEPDHSKDVPGLYDRVGRVLNPDAPKDYQAYKHVYDRMMQANGEGPYSAAAEDVQPDARDGRALESGRVCTAGCQRSLPTSCCPVRSEIVYPQFARSAVTDQMIAIVQDMHNFVQPFYKRTCMSAKCNFMRGNCTQKYTPHAVFSAPMSAVQSAVMSAATHRVNMTITSRSLDARKTTLSPAMFGQDFILVESGCECRPDFETGATYNAQDDDEYDRFD